MDILLRLVDSKSKIRLLSKLLERPNSSFSVSELGRLADLPKSSVSVIVMHWQDEELIVSQKQGRNKLVSINSKYYLLPELRKIFEKTKNPQKPFLDKLKSLPLLENPKIKAIVVFGSRIKGGHSPASDLDIMVGVETKDNSVTEKAVEAFVAATKKTGVRFSPTLMEKNEIKGRWKEKDKFILDILTHGKIIKGGKWLEHIQTAP